MTRLVLSVAAAALAAGCVESFSGSNIQIDFSAAVLTPAGDDYDGERAPANTYFTLYAVDHVYQLDADGNPVLDGDGDPLIEQSFLFGLQRFEIRPVIDLASPCFIEVENTPYPGLHVTQVATRLKQDICDRLAMDATCFDLAVTDPPAGATEEEIIDVITAEIRMGNLPDLQSLVKAVTTYSTYRYPGGIPAADLIDDSSNAERLERCQEAWADEAASRVEGDEGFYEGSDKVFTLPLNGTLYGMVEGMNPVNGVGLVGGSSMFVDEVLTDADAYTLNWQFKDLEGPAGPDYPDDFDREPSDTGYTFMSGLPEARTRGTVNVRLVSPLSDSTYAEVAIFPDLGEDDVNF
jgi:hypothetical protein